MSDFIGYARTNLFKVESLDAFRADLDGLSLPLSHLQAEELAGFIWTGEGQPFSEQALKSLVPVLQAHALEPVFVIVSGGVKGEVPLMECTVVDPKSKKVTRNTLQDLFKGREVNLSPAPVLWAA